MSLKRAMTEAIPGRHPFAKLASTSLRFLRGALPSRFHQIESFKLQIFQFKSGSIIEVAVFCQS